MYHGPEGALRPPPGPLCDTFAMAVYSPWCDNCGHHIKKHTHRESWDGVPFGGEPKREPFNTPDGAA